MNTTKKRITITLTKEELRELTKLGLKFAENPSQVIKRALTILNYITFNQRLIDKGSLRDENDDKPSGI